MDYELVYDDRFEETNKSDARLLNDETLKKEEDDCFEDDGEDWNEDWPNHKSFLRYFNIYYFPINLKMIK